MPSKLTYGDCIAGVLKRPELCETNTETETDPAKSIACELQ